MCWTSSWNLPFWSLLFSSCVLGRSARSVIPGRTHDLGHPGASDAFLARDCDLSGDLAGVGKRLPLDGLSEELDHPESSRLLSRLKYSAPGRDGRHERIGRRMAR